METNLGRVVLIKDINFGSLLTEFNNKLYFTANDGINGEEPWVSDGTTAGTQLLANINPSRGSYPNANSYSSDNFTEFKNKLYFSADDSSDNRELWTTDGTTNGTQLVKDINPNSVAEGLASSSNPNYLTEFNNKLYFAAQDGVNNRELWITDGTTEGTQLLKDINLNDDFSGAYYGSYPKNFTEFKNKLYFSANNGFNGQELWVTNGTTAGTKLLKDINPRSIYFNRSSNPNYLTEFNNKLYFSADNGINDTELWVSDGTTNGTRLVKDINPNRDNKRKNLIGDSFPRDFIEFNNKLYFSANDGVNGRELWVSDGTTNGTQLVKDINPVSFEGYRSDILPNPNSSEPNYLTEFNNKLYFTADNGNGRELWVSDGTTNGTQLVVDINPDGNSFASNLIEFNNKLYFTADDGINGKELWVSDGTTEGTQLVADINPGTDSSFPRNLKVFGNELFFTANNGVNGNELFKLTFDGSTTITGTNGSDKLNGTVNSDKIEGLNGNDTLSGNTGNDTLLGGNGNDNLVGGAGNDSLFGGAGGDRITGGNSSDILDGGIGFDILTGGANNDLFVLRKGDGSDSIVDFKLGSDNLGLAGDLEFDDLTLSGNTIKSGNELLATLIGVNTGNLTELNFTTV